MVYVVLVMVVLVKVLFVRLAIVLLFVVFVIVRWERSGVVHGAGNSGVVPVVGNGGVVYDVGNSDFSNGLIRGAGDSELDLLVYLPLVVPS